MRSSAISDRSAFSPDRNNEVISLRSVADRRLKSTNALLLPDHGNQRTK